MRISDWSSDVCSSDLVDMLSPTKVRYQVNRAITVFNPAGEERARLVIHYDKATSVKRISGEVYDEAGFQLRKFTKRDCRDESAVSNFSLYEDSRVKHFLPAMAGYPYTVVYRNRKRGVTGKSVSCRLDIGG